MSTAGEAKAERMRPIDTCMRAQDARKVPPPSLEYLLSAPPSRRANRPSAPATSSSVTSVAQQPQVRRAPTPTRRLEPFARVQRAQNPGNRQQLRDSMARRGAGAGAGAGAGRPAARVQLHSPVRAKASAAVARPRRAPTPTRRVGSGGNVAAGRTAAAAAGGSTQERMNQLLTRLKATTPRTVAAAAATTTGTRSRPPTPQRVARPRALAPAQRATSVQSQVASQGAAGTQRAVCAMPMLRDGALENLGEGGETQWFMLHAVERGLELRFYCEESGELRGVISVGEIERVGPTEEEAAQFEVVLPEATYRLRAADAEDREDWMMRLGWEPDPAPAPEPAAAEQPERPLGRLLVVASCPEKGTLKPDGSAPYDQEVMTKLIELRDDQVLHVAFDRAGTSTSSRSDKGRFELAAELQKQGFKGWQYVIKDTKWFHAYEQMVKMALQQIQSEYPECTLEVVCLNGGPITQVEQREMPRILEGAVRDCRAKGVTLVYSMRCVDYREIDAMVLENSREKLYDLHGVARNTTYVNLSTDKGGLRCALPLLVPALSQHAALQTLILRGNALTALPESIGQLSTLQRLDLVRNQLTTLPESIGQLSALRELSLFGNQLATLPESIGQLSALRRLDLSGNQLTTLPESIGQLSALRELRLSRNQLATLPDGVQALKDGGCRVYHGQSRCRVYLERAKSSCGSCCGSRPKGD